MVAKIGAIGRWRNLATASVLALVAAGPAAAQAAGSGGPVLTAQAASIHSFDIPAGPLPQAIAAFSAITGLQALYTEPSVRDHRTQPVRGEMAAQEALDRLLAGTGLAGAITPSGTVTVNRVAAGGDPSVLSLPPVQIYGAKNATTLGDSLASVGVVTAEEIERRQIGSFRETFRTMANVMDSDWTDAGFVIRGVNSEGLTPGGAPLASLYIDGAQQTVQGARRGARGLWDVEQVEVYRGPQSTLTGRAALAGAVYIKTKDPSFEPEAKVQATAGTMNTLGGAFVLGGPLAGQQLAYRVSGEFERSRNDINYPTYSDFARYDEFIEDRYYQVRGKLLFLPESAPDTSALLTYSFSHDSPYTSDIAGPALGFDYSERRGDFNLPVFAETRSVDTHNVSLQVVHDLDSALRFTSLTTYSYTDMQRPSVNEGSAGETNVNTGGVEQSVLSQELRANYESGRWKGVLGLYFAAESDDGGYNRPDYFGRNDVSRTDSDGWNAAVFGEAGFEFLPSWTVIAGGRVDHIDKTNESVFSRNGVTTVDQKLTFEETVFLPKIGLVKELAPEHTLGFTAQRGFRSGGAGVQTSTGQVYTFDPEFAWNYELSYKGSFLGGRLRAGANLFHMDWSNQQVEVYDDINDFRSSRITNAASSTSRGFELEGRYLVMEGLDAFLSVGYVSTEFKNFNDISAGDLSGMPFPEAPRWSVAFGGVYQHPSGLFVGADAKYLSSYLGRLDSLPHEYVDSYWLANAQVGYRAEDLTVTLFAENIFDNEYFVYNARTATGEDLAATLGMRRVVGVTATLSF